MEDYTQQITAYNDGEKEANVTYTIKSITILGQTYTDDDGTDLSALIASETYPFHISVSIDNATMAATNGSSNIVIAITWPFEQGDNETDIQQKDALDTYWGELAANYYQANPNTPSISMQLELKATQVE
ncbi:MAG: hypothetical protein FWF46_01715 [Oscillospiraceae bacterium]|nr:hypothetical protein [Oscillospiraceae bacterium]